MDTNTSEITVVWLDDNRKKMLKLLGLKSDKKSEMALFKRLCNAKANARFHENAIRAAGDLGAPTSILAELKQLEQEAAKRFRRLGPQGEKLLRKIVGDIENNSGIDKIITRTVRATAKGKVSAQAASDILIGVNDLAIKAAKKDDGRTEYGCIACFILLKLFCFIVKSCRPKKST